MRQRKLAAFDLFLVRGLHLFRVVREQERAEMIIDAGPLQTFAGREIVPARQRLAAELLMMGGARRPCAAPVVVAADRLGDFLEVGEHDAVGDETRAPMREGGGQKRIGCHGIPYFSPRRYHGMKRRVAHCTRTSKPTPKAASSSTPTKASLWW